MEDKHIYICLFGKVTISDGEETVILSSLMGKQLVSLFEMLVYFHDRTLAKETIIDTLWSNNDNPNNVMKFSIFRLRNYLKTVLFLKDMNIIVTTKNGYSLNPDISFIIDTEVFNTHYEALKGKPVNESNISNVLSMIEVYAGDLYQCDSNSWLLQATAFYRSIYMEYVKKLCSYFLKEESYEEILPIALSATLLQPDNEDIHYYYLKAMMQLGDYEKAMHHYNSITKMMVDVYEIPITQRLRDLYRVILENNKSCLSIQDIKEQLTLSKVQSQAFFCEYDVFEYVYHVALRRKERDKARYYLVMINLSLIDDEQLHIKTMNKLKKTIAVVLRSVDIFTRLNAEQFLVLLGCKNEEDAHIAIQRVLSHFYKRVQRSDVKIVYQILGI